MIVTAVPVWLVPVARTVTPGEFEYDAVPFTAVSVPL